jgi:carbohydrate-selective porin OprB
MKHLKLQPDVQYFHNTGGKSTIPNAWVFGVRVIFKWE